jgi:hypothetical protein
MTPKKTLLLVFIHGFKGGEDTFGPNYKFTADLRSLVATALPKLDVRVLVYPRFETRGDLAVCVRRFTDWLQEKVIDLEVARGTPSPTVEPGVRTVLLGHSMGGIVAAEALVGLTSDEPVLSPSDGEGEKPPTAQTSSSTNLNAMMFPYIQGVLAFDTPYLGIAPGVVAHGAEGHYTAATAAMAQLSGLTGAIWGGQQAAGAAGGTPLKEEKKPAALPAPEPKKDDKPAAGGGWGWGRMAMYAGAGAALAASGAAAYMKREQLTEGWGWATSHLEFVGCLARGEELRRRVAYLVRAERELGVGFANLYTRLGAGATASQGNSVVGSLLPSQRTFCNMPRSGAAGTWKEAVNDAATDETGAHMSKFIGRLRMNSRDNSALTFP